ncbi:MAG: PSD1 domain-containing protein [Planctomycetales bacterium]|nr:PSD1 domain-containing protein [Planctomycetales bacterium]
MNRHSSIPQILLIAMVLACAPAQLVVADEPLTYESDVRPILKLHCFHCHGEGGVIEGGLDLRLRRLIADGGDSGDTVVPGEPDESYLLQRLLDGDMPPEEISLRPTAEEIAKVQKWISDGAVSTQEEPEGMNPDHYITQQEREYWAFQPVQRRPLPEVKAASRVRNAIDSWILAGLEAQGLTLSEDTDAETLIRRVTFDLLGLPPTPEEVEAFVNDTSPDAYSRLLERLLDSPHYGERWGQHWLDVAGYADSEGYTEDDPERPYAFHYRDYVIRAFNDDKPFDEFIVEQLAGDELVPQPWNNLTPEQADKLVATGFLRMAPDGTGTAGVDQSLARNDVMAKTIEIVSTSLMGLTVACAQCHNHRYDPILHEDYFAMRAIFEPSLDWKDWKVPASRRVSLYTDADREAAAKIEEEAKKVLAERSKREAEAIEATFQAELAKLDESLHEPIRAARDTPEKERTEAQKKLLGEHPSVNVSAGSLYLYDKKAANELKEMMEQATAIRATKPKEEFVRANWEEAGKTPPPTYLFHRGDHEQPKQVVPPNTLTVLTSAKSPRIPENDSQLPTTGRRLAFARWLTAGDHPLVARVIVNRLWLNHFGQGLVLTPGDFGFLGERPTHPELLDMLADEFVASGWSVKHMHRLIMGSSTYRQASLRHPQGEAIDVDNRLYWRMPVRRLQAETLRDSALAITGELNAKAFGPPIPIMPDVVGQIVIGIENSSAGRPGPVLPMHGEDLRRSIYVQSRRSKPLSVLVPFDLPRMEPNCTVRNASTVSPQALLMMNSDFVVTRGQQLAARVQREAGEELTAQIKRAWQLVYAAQPNEQELEAAQQFVQQQTEHFAAQPQPKKEKSKAKGKDKDKADAVTPQEEAVASLCHALLSSNRFLYVD